MGLNGSLAPFILPILNEAKHVGENFLINSELSDDTKRNISVQ